jgi:hypothetical protein
MIAMELTDILIAQVILIVLIVAIVTGLVQSANVIFEAHGSFKNDNVPKDQVQSIKKNKIMPKLWAPMFEGIVAEMLLVAFVVVGPLGDYGRITIGIMAAVFAIMIVLLARFFSLSGRT